MSLLFPSSNTSKPPLSKKFRVTSQTQLKKVSNTYWNKQLPKKGIRMKGQSGELEYVKATGVKAKISELLKKRGYISETTLKKDLLKEKVRMEDRKKVYSAVQGKFAKKEEGTLSPEQIQANVKRARAVSRIMSTKGKSTAENIVHGRYAGRIKQSFKSDYSHLGIKGVSYNIGGKELSTDDPRYGGQEKKESVTSINSQGKIRGVTDGNQDLISKKEKSIAEEVGSKNQEKNEINPEKKVNAPGGSSPLSLNPVKKIEKEKKERGMVYYDNLGRTVDSEFQGGIVFGGRKMIHLSDLINNKPSQKEDEAKKETSDRSGEEKKKIQVTYIGNNSLIYKKINNYCSHNDCLCGVISDNILVRLNEARPNYIFLDSSIEDSFFLYSKIKQLNLPSIKKVIMLIAKNDQEISKAIDNGIKYYQLKEELANGKIFELIR